MDDRASRTREPSRFERELGGYYIPPLLSVKGSMRRVVEDPRTRLCLFHIRDKSTRYCVYNLTSRQVRRGVVERVFSIFQVALPRRSAPTENSDFERAEKEGRPDPQWEAEAPLFREFRLITSR